MLLKYYRSLHDNVLLLQDFNMSFSKKNIKDLCDLFELNHIIKDPTRFKRQTPHALIISILTKRHRFLIHLLSRLAFLVTVVWFVQCFARHFVKVHQNLWACFFWLHEICFFWPKDFILFYVYFVLSN